MRRMRDSKSCGATPRKSEATRTSLFYIDACSAPADGIDARQMRGGTFQRVVDAVVMVLRVALEIRVPGDLLGEDHLAVDDRGALAVGAAEIEPDPAAVEVAAERDGRFARRGHRVERCAIRCASARDMLRFP